MSFILKIAPPFLRKLDDHLRVNQTWIWTTRIHLHLYFSLLLTVLFAFIGFIYNIDLTDVPDKRAQNTFFGILFVPAIIVFAYMVYGMSLFNTDKSSAYRFKYQEFFLFIIYYFTFCLPLLIPFTACIILNERISGLVSDEQFAEDKSNFNKGLAFFPRINYNYDYYPGDSVYLAEINKSYEQIQEEMAIIGNGDSYRTIRFRQWELMRDSVFWHRGVFSETRPKLYYTDGGNWNEWNDYEYRYYEDYEIDNRWRGRDPVSVEDSLYELYLVDINTKRDVHTAKKQISIMSELLNKYSGDYQFDENVILNDFVSHNYAKSGAYDNTFLGETIYESRDNITSIHVAKLKRVNVWDSDAHYFLVIFVFCLTLLFQVFKNVYWKQMLLSVAIGGLLVTLLVVIEVSSRSNGDFIITASVLIPVIFLLASIKGFSIKRFSWILNQVNILLSVVLPFFPLLILVYLEEQHKIFKIGYFDQYKEYYKDIDGNMTWQYTKEYYRLVKLIWQVTLWSGILLYVFVWNSYLKTLFLRYWALPKPK